MMQKILMLYYPLLDSIMNHPDAVLETYEQYGCQIIEVALPCENPCFDGAVIRESMRRILETSTIFDMFESVRRVKEKFPYIKIQIVSYIETIEQTGYPEFASLCKNANVDSLLSPDASDYQLTKLDHAFAEICEIPIIRFIPYTNNDEMLEKAKHGKGYLFMQSGNSKSGEYRKIGEELKEKIEYLRKNGIDLPIIVGFGIKNGEQIKACYQCGADGVAIGSGLLDYIARGEIEKYLVSLVSE